MGLERTGGSPCRAQRGRVQCDDPWRGVGGGSPLWRLQTCSTVAARTYERQQTGGILLSNDENVERKDAEVEIQVTWRCTALEKQAQNP